MATTPTFARISLDEFAELLQRFHFTRQVNAVHMHHTWRPRHADFRGHDTIVSMWRFHTQTNGWRDIAQHITIDPDGFIWLGRNWNFAPASASGHNGNSAFGPFMFEMIGDFDTGHDPFGGAQKETTLGVIALLQSHFELPLESLRLHNMMSSKSCPGTAIDYESVLAEVKQARTLADGAAPARRSRGLEAAAESSVPGPAPAPALAQALRSLQRPPGAGTEPAYAELAHDHGEAAAERLASLPGAARGAGLDAATLAALRPHVINLRMGRLSGSGEFSSTPEDVAAIFEQHLPAAVQEAKADGRKLPVMFFAHGGLVSEASGLQVAHKHVAWWQRNGVYPVYFVWETGFFETIAQLLSRARRGRGASRDIFDFTTDPLIELAARALQGPRIWGGMKASAEHAVDPPTAADPIGGGAAYAARLLKSFCAAHGADVSLHAIGHSAGAVFHSYFLPTAHALGVPSFSSAHLLAPAVRADTFKQRLMPQIGAGLAAENLTVFTMQKDHERKDNCAKVYRKSLLYLIHHALEDQIQTPLLGLEKSLRGDAALKGFFGLGGGAAGDSSVIWSPTASDSGRSASQSTTHGGFDDDAPTMNSLVRRILGKADADAIDEYPRQRSAGPAEREWIDEVDWPEGFDEPPAVVTSPPLSPPPVPPRPPLDAGAPAPAAGPVVVTPTTGARRVALCVGIDDYPNPEHQLSGCVNDARKWAATLAGLGFETRLLLDAQATRSELNQQLAALIDGSRAGDVIVFQYAGHGTHLPDVDGDETDGEDEALCPVDFESGALYIDDDIAALFKRIADGVNLSVFMDCCHSGTNSRFAARPGTSRLPPGAKPRFINVSDETVAAHRAFRSRLAAGQRGAEPPARMRDIKFAACQDHQVAWESGGSGEFTLRATRLLEGGIEGVSNEQFVQRVVAAFGSGARQTPMLDCAEGGSGLALLQPLQLGAPHPMRSGAGVAAGPAAPTAGPDTTRALNLLAQAMQALTNR